MNVIRSGRASREAAFRGWTPRHGWQSWAYLGFLVFVLQAPLFDGDPGWSSWAVTLLLIGLFLPLHFLAYTDDGGVRLLPVAGMIVLGIFGVGVEFNGGAGVFFIYAAAHSGRAARPATGWWVIVAVTAMVLVLFALSPIPFPVRWFVFAPSLVCVPVIGSMCILDAARERNATRARLARADAERLAVIAERERIARDLHDVLGHALSMITLKSELAARVAAAEPGRAAREMTEVEAISRDTLGQVREAVRGYRSKGLGGEIAGVRRALESAGIDFAMRHDAVTLSAPQESALALALREGVTNIVRHSRASRVDGVIERSGDEVVLTLTDNGRGGGAEGDGLAGLRERIAALGGGVERSANGGTTLTVTLPLGRERAGSDLGDDDEPAQRAGSAEPR